MVVGHSNGSTYDKIEQSKRKYFASPKGKAAFRKYYFSDKGQTRRKKLKTEELLTRECSAYLQENPGKTVEDFLNQLQGGI